MPTRHSNCVLDPENKIYSVVKSPQFSSFGSTIFVYCIVLLLVVRGPKCQDRFPFIIRLGPCIALWFAVDNRHAPITIELLLRKLL